MPKKKKYKKDVFLKYCNSIISSVSKFLKDAKNFIFEKFIEISVAALVIIMFMLGFTINWQCGSHGWECGGGYTPAKPDNVKKILKIR